MPFDIDGRRTVRLTARQRAAWCCDGLMGDGQCNRQLSDGLLGVPLWATDSATDGLAIGWLGFAIDCPTDGSAIGWSAFPNGQCDRRLGDGLPLQR